VSKEIESISSLEEGSKARKKVAYFFVESNMFKVWGGGNNLE